MSDSEFTLVRGLVRILASTVLLEQNARFSSWRLGPTPDADILQAALEDRRHLDTSAEALVHACKSIGCELPTRFADLARLSSIDEWIHSNSILLCGAMASEHHLLSDDVGLLLTVAPFEDGDPMVIQLHAERKAHASWSKRWRDLEKLGES